MARNEVTTTVHAMENLHGRLLQTCLAFRFFVPHRPILLIWQQATANSSWRICYALVFSQLSSSQKYPILWMSHQTRIIGTDTMQMDADTIAWRRCFITQLRSMCFIQRWKNMCKLKRSTLYRFKITCYANWWHSIPRMRGLRMNRADISTIDTTRKIECQLNRTVCIVAWYTRNGFC